MWPFNLSVRLLIADLVGRYLTNYLIRRESICKQFLFSSITHQTALLSWIFILTLRLLDHGRHNGVIRIAAAYIFPVFHDVTLKPRNCGFTRIGCYSDNSNFDFTRTSCYSETADCGFSRIDCYFETANFDFTRISCYSKNADFGFSRII